MVRILVAAVKCHNANHDTKVPAGSNSFLVCPLDYLIVLYRHQPVPLPDSELFAMSGGGNMG